MNGSKASESAPVSIKNVDTKDPSLLPAFSTWLITRSKENLVAFRLRNGHKEALLFGSNNVGATGLAISYHNWYVQLEGQSIDFFSLSTNPELIFWDRSGVLNYYTMEFSDRFIMDKDWKHFTADLQLFKVAAAGGESQLISEEKNVSCK